MPAPRADNREEVRMLVQQFGCTKAAEKTGIPLNTVLSWSARGGWLEELKPERVMERMPESIRPTAIAAIKPGDVMAEELRDYSERSRLALAKASTKGLEHLARSDEEVIVAQSDSLLKLGKAAGMAGDWQSASSGPQVNIQLLG